jgi:AdoMet-dependent rRNA methyltransferase SPB1
MINLKNIFVFLKLTKKLEKARKKAEVLSDKPDMTESERNKEIKSIYKKAGLLAKKKTDIKYVVSKKGFRGKQVAKSKGVKGPYKMVDKRLKKDKRVMKRNNMRRK